MFLVLRSIGAVLLGLVVAFLVVAATDGLSQLLIYKLPDGIDPSNLEQLKTIMGNIPTQAFLFMLAGWALAAFLGAFLSAWLSGRSPQLHGFVVGGLFIVATAANLWMLPHPTWLRSVTFPVLALAIFLGASRVKGKHLSAA